MITSLADQPTTRSPGSIRLTGEQVRALTFRRPPFPHRGYDESQVETLIGWIAASLDRGEAIPAEKLHDVRLGRSGRHRRGYDEADVDAFLRIVERAVAA